MHFDAGIELLSQGAGDRIERRRLAAGAVGASPHVVDVDLGGIAVALHIHDCEIAAVGGQLVPNVAVPSHKTSNRTFAVTAALNCGREHASAPAVEERWENDK